MESFAFWYREKGGIDGGSKLEATMNFNLWCECGWNKLSFSRMLYRRKKEKHPFLDIGFRVANLHKAEELYLFVPFKIEDNRKCEIIKDLGIKYHDTKVVDATFNESCRTTISSCSKSIDVKYTNIDSTENIFKIYQLDIEHDIGLSYFSGGTILSIRTDAIIDGDASSSEDYYFRFRIKNAPLDFLIHNYTIFWKMAQSLYSKTYMIDFRFNNVRSLDNTLIERISAGNNKKVSIKAVHFLLMTKAYVDVYSTDFKSIRMLEHDVWKDYVDGNDTKDLVAYHYVNKAKETDEGHYIDSSELFVKFSMGKSVFLRYVIFTIVLGLITAFFQWFFTQINYKFSIIDKIETLIGVIF